MVNHITNSPNQTKKLGEILAKEILKTSPKKKAPKEYLRYPTGQAFVLGLEGDLGGGKTTFLQGFAKGLGIKQKILSPTFVIMKRFKIKPRTRNFVSVRGRDLRFKFNNFYHIDCYRIQKPKEILDLGFKKIISNPENIVAVEWSDHIRKILPKNTIILKFEFVNKKTRKIVIK